MKATNPNYLFPVTVKGYKNAFKISYRGIEYKLFFHQEEVQEDMFKWFVEVLAVGDNWDTDSIEVYNGMDKEFDRINAFDTKQDIIKAVEIAASKNELEIR